MRIKFKTLDDINTLAKKLMTLDGEDHSLKSAKNFIIATDGHTYFIPDILELSSQDAQKYTNVFFKTETGETVSLQDIRKNKRTNLPFLYNQSLFDTLIMTNLVPGKILNPVLPLCGINKEHFPLIDPIITPNRQTYESFAIYNWMSENSVDPVTKQPLKKEDILPNHALRQLIQIRIDQLINRRLEISEQQERQHESIIITNALNKYKDTLSLQARYLQQGEDHYNNQLSNVNKQSINVDKRITELTSINDIEQHEAILSAHSKHYENKNDGLADAMLATRKPIIRMGVGMALLGAAIMITGTAFVVIAPPVTVAMILIGAPIMLSGMIVAAELSRTDKLENKKSEHYANMQQNIETHRTGLKIQAPLVLAKKRQFIQERIKEINNIKPDRPALSLSSSSELKDKGDSPTNKCEQIKKPIDVVDQVKKPAAPATSIFGKIGSLFGGSCSFEAAKPEEKRPLLSQKR